MTNDGIYAQWIQAYNLDLQSVHQVVLTMKQVFPKVELWMPAAGDLLILGFKDSDYRHRVDLVKEKLERGHGREMLWKGFLSNSAESIYGRMLASDESLMSAIPVGVKVNTDDLNSLEFRVARRPSGAGDLRKYLEGLFDGFDLPAETSGQLDTILLREERLMMLWGGSRNYGLKEPELAAYAFFVQENYRNFFAIWDKLIPRSLKSRLYGAMAVASSNRPGEQIITGIAGECPGYASLFLGLNLIHRNQFDEGLAEVKKGLQLLEKRGWMHSPVAGFVLKKLIGLGEFFTEEQLKVLFDIFEDPLPSEVMDGQRIGLLSHLSTFLPDEYKVRVIRQFDDKACLPPKLALMAREYDPRPRNLEQFRRLREAGYQFGPIEDLRKRPGQGMIKR